ncbi:unnamed protein product, partial [Lymnaea stagnalis]
MWYCTGNSGTSYVEAGKELTEQTKKKRNALAKWLYQQTNKKQRIHFYSSMLFIVLPAEVDFQPKSYPFNFIVLFFLLKLQHTQFHNYFHTASTYPVPQLNYFHTASTYPVPQ